MAEMLISPLETLTRVLHPMSELSCEKYDYFELFKCHCWIKIGYFSRHPFSGLESLIQILQQQLNPALDWWKTGATPVRECFQWWWPSSLFYSAVKFAVCINITINIASEVCLTMDCGTKLKSCDRGLRCVQIEDKVKLLSFYLSKSVQQNIFYLYSFALDIWCTDFINYSLLVTPALTVFMCSNSDWLISELTNKSNSLISNHFLSFSH